MALKEILKIVAQKRFSQFPLYDKGRFVGLITLRMLGYWFAQESLKGEIRLEGRKAEDLLIKDGKESNYQFVPATTTVTEVEDLFHKMLYLKRY